MNFLDLELHALELVLGAYFTTTLVNRKGTRCFGINGLAGRSRRSGSSCGVARCSKCRRASSGQSGGECNSESLGNNTRHIRVVLSLIPISTFPNEPTELSEGNSEQSICEYITPAQAEEPLNPSIAK
ncbi:hypothetical protein CORTU0001_0045 [Corynebacterium tuberculostearicum SK141]|uniref:Uncharacterized protein n=1 Tax=Corynebacterium tuberculostearicum SK141 TaxID=553206 RepID=C6RBC3_9CORY|nr:hypothetical protein CORTU0001_0045 [Corynebacterium tuberculostearicum SK141]